MIKIFVANWKMQKSYSQTIKWCIKNNKELAELSHRKNIIICPSFESIAKVQTLLNKNINIGAQDCSAFEKGAYTGQVSAISLREIGINYCLIGHSETKINITNTDNLNNSISEKYFLLIKNNIKPIICIGETQEEREKNITYDILKHQIDMIINKIKKEEIKINELIIAYEPIWAIGTGKVPKPEELNNTLIGIKKYINSILSDIELTILYGGSINLDNIEEFKNMGILNGFLLGNSSLDFQLFKKIVLLSISA
ncbi:triose-phosphate isomerase [Candidatus Babela massiliensis]|uniref:Triosephosphate isomerase n=1 Tax=Candidatus Babela massiliensis TaxID=673862 RepID=V6DIN4_9BACT|nr:triose-phosphate isomerase [Candidatus Babela massiliensis]CDK30788.1 Triosephosphate isomerase [Candidatus Babela massiliensis]